jgi:hypothetical protein
MGLVSPTLPVVINPSSVSLNRGHRLALSSGASGEPAQPTADDEHEDDQSLYAEPKPIPPEIGRRLVWHLATYEWQVSSLDHPFHVRASSHARLSAPTIAHL